jgi:hypothetical protein
MPGGGMPGGGMGGRGGPMRRPDGLSMPKPEDMIPPDPLYAWANRLREGRTKLQLQASDWPLFDALLRDLDEVVKSRERQMLRLISRSRPVTSALPDPKRDIQNFAEESRNITAALDDLGKSLLAANAANATLQSWLSEQYAQAQVDSRSAQPPVRPGA